MTRISTAELKAKREALTRQLTLDSEIAYIRVKLAARRVIVALKAGFDPAQPRDGHGQWARTGGSAGGSSGGAGSGFDPTGDPTGDGGSDPSPDTTTEYGSADDSWSSVTTTTDANGDLTAQTVINRDGSAIQSDFNRDAEAHTVVTPDRHAITFTTSGDTQTITNAQTGEVLGRSTWGDNGPEPEGGVQPAYLPPPAIPATVEAAITAATALFVWLSGRNGPEGAAVLAFKANEYGPGGEPKLEAEWVGRVSRNDVDNACPRYGEVQSRTDDAADRAQREGNYWTAQQYGTAVHTLLKYDIDRLLDKDFVAEISLMKSDPDARYGVRGSIRVDVLENVRNGTVCVYDIKTGDRGLSLPRSAEIAREVFGRYSSTNRIIVVETRPRR